MKMRPLAVRTFASAVAPTLFALLSMEACIVETPPPASPATAPAATAEPTRAAAPPAEPAPGITGAPVATAPPPAPAPAPASATPSVVASGAEVSWSNWVSSSGDAAPGACKKESNKELCWDGVDNNCDGQIDEGCPYQGGPLHFIIAWRAAVDLDLHVIAPDGSEVSWNKRTSGLGFSLDQDCHGMKGGKDDCPFGKVENVFLPTGRAMPRGHYKIYVEMFDSRGQADAAVKFSFGMRVGTKTFMVPLELPNKKGTRKEFGFDIL